MSGVWVLSSSLSVVAAVVLTIIQSVQHKPYMDEVFHIPQARQYCQYNFTHWDPMITTLPVLYISSFLMLLPFAWLQQIELLDVCSNFNLRACNIGFFIGNCILLHHLTRKLRCFQGPVSFSQQLLNAAVCFAKPMLSG